MKAIVLGLLLTLSACATGPQRSEDALKYTCAGAVATLEALDVARHAGKLSAETEAKVRKVAVELQPICGADAEPTLTDVQLLALQRLAAELEAAKED
jgi:hypothetical protein